MGDIHVFCVDLMMAWVRRLRPIYRASNVWVHEVVSNVYEDHDTKQINR